MFTSHLEGLYPEWDEFYLIICDVCGIIIRPQALEKHLIKKHRINVHPSAQQQTKQDQNQHQQQPSKPTQNGIQPIKQTQNGIPPTKQTQNGISTAQPTLNSQRLWGGKHALDSVPKPAIKKRPCDWVKVRQAPDTSLITSSSSSLLSSTPACLTGGETSSRYQDRKWRNTYNVLRETFF